MISFEDFIKADLRVGEIIEVKDFARAKKPAYKIKVNFGDEIGIKNSSFQAKTDYKIEDLLGMQIIGVVNLQPKNVAGFISEVLILGVPAIDGSLSLLTPSRRPSLVGGKVH